jgi:Na+-translocating ferredoxin:NAD+ oxidoreductase RnfD subunit
MDPRLIQICCLSSFATLGLAFGVVPTDWLRLGVFFGVCSATEFCGYRYFRPSQKFTLLSAMITTLSLWILIRVDSMLWMMAIPFLAISSKYALRYSLNGSAKHFFNPANFGMMLPILLGAPVWLSPGNWAGYSAMSMWFLVLGVVLTMRVHKLDTALWFVGGYVGLHFLRHLWLQDPHAIFLHKLENPGLVLFSFFMITDPRSTPSSVWGRGVFAVFVASISFYLSAKNFGTNDFFYVLFFACWATPLLDFLGREQGFQWTDISQVHKRLDTLDFNRG